MKLEELHTKYRLLAVSLQAMSAGAISGRAELCPVVAQDIADELVALTLALERHAYPPSMPMLAA